MRPGERNLVTDVAGLVVGNAQDAAILTGVTVLSAGRPFVAGIHVMGGAPGTRESDLLAPDRLVQEVDALVLSGGSAFGLDAPSGVADALREAGRGFEVGGQRVPIVPGAILFDLLNGGDKAWRENPYKRLGRAALAEAGEDFALGSVGAGFGATLADMRGGLGSASLVLESGHVVGALVAVNAVGTACGSEGAFWAAPWEFADEFGGRGPVRGHDPSQLAPTKLGAREATTIAIVATDAALDQAQATRLAIAAHDGMARALVPSHTPFDGDLVFAAATGEKPLFDAGRDMLELGHAASVCLARAIARGVYEAAGGMPGVPSWRERFGSLR